MNDIKNYINNIVKLINTEVANIAEKYGVLVRKGATVASYNSSTKKATVYFDGDPDTESAPYYNKSGHILEAGQRVYIFHLFGNPSQGWIMMRAAAYDDDEGGGGGGLDGVSITGSGNALTNASLSENILTLNKGETFATQSALTTHTSNSDIHVTASDKTRWNNKSDFSGSYNDLTDVPTSFTPASHSHGNITNDGGINTTTQIASGDRLVISDTSAGDLNASSITFGSSTTQYLANNGTWQTPNIPNATTTTPKMDGTATVGTETKWAKGDHVHPTDTSRASASDLSEHISDSTVHITATERTNWNAKYTKPSTGIPKTDLATGVQTSLGLADTAVQDANYVHTDNNYTTAEKNKLAGIASGAEVNQNAFSNIKVGSTTVAADSKTDTLELVAGSNITLTPDATNDKVTIAANVGVTGVKGNDEGTYRTGNVNITPENIGAPKGAISNGGIQEVLNPFAPRPNTKISIDRLENAFYFADKRFNVSAVQIDSTSTETALSDRSISYLFDMSENDTRNVPANGSLVVTIDFSDEVNGVFPNYPYGYVYLSFYYTKVPLSVSARVYGRHTGTNYYWKDLTAYADGANTSGNNRFIIAQTVMYNMQKLEITVNGGSEVASLSEIAYYLNRSDKSKDMPYVSKLRDETLYYSLTAPNFIGDLQGNASTATNASKVNNHTVNSDVPANAVFTDTTYTPASANPLMDGTVAVGTSEKYAREDHRHPVDTSRASASDLTSHTSNTTVHITAAERTAWNAKQAALTEGTDYLNKTHLDSTYVAKTDVGANGGVAELDSTGKIPSSQLPSFVDDVLEYSSRSNFPATGEAGKIYIATDTNLTYRWSGSTYVMISSSLALGETSSTAYRGDRGKIAYDHSQDSTVHVTAAQKTAWTAKYDKPSGGIPKTDLASAVQTSLGLADTAVQDANYVHTDNNYTTTEKNKLAGIASGAEVNVQADWNQTTTTADDYIKNKPTIPTVTDTYSGTSSNAMSGKAVKQAIDALDGTISGSAGAAKTLTAFSQVDGKVSATFGNIAITTQQLTHASGIRGTNDVTLAPLISTTRANRLAFLPASQIIVEKTTDGGATWEDAGVSDAVKLGLFSEQRSNIYIPLIDGVRSLLCGVRVTFTAMRYNVPSGTGETQKYNYWNSDYVLSTERYCSLSDMYFWLSSLNDSIGVKVERATGTGAKTNTWSTIFNDSSYYMTGWSGSDNIHFSYSNFGGGVSQTNNYWNYRITFMTKGVNGTDTMSTSSNTSQQTISEIRAYGENVWTIANQYMAYDHMYSKDSAQNVSFPAKVTATSFSGDLSKAKIQIPGNQYYESGSNYAMDFANSDVIGLNGVYFSDSSDGAGEGVNFYRGASTWDSFRARNGLLEFSPNRSSGNAGTWYTIYHTGNNPSYDNLTDKPTIPIALADLQEDTTHRAVTDSQIAEWTAKSEFSGSYNDLTNKPTIPTTLAQLAEDSTHRLTTDAEKATWNAKYYKPTSGVPMSDLSDQVQTLLRSIGTETATFTDEIIIGDVRLKRYTTKRLMITDVES